MWLRHLSLNNYRNYAKQDLDLPRGVTLIIGDNAQGKSNLLEAIFLLATTKAARAATEGEVVRWEALDEPQPVARVAAEIERADGALQVEVLVAGRPKAGVRERVPASKRLRLNGVPRRATDVIGQLTAVLFTTEDMDLVSGPPSGRRRFIDTMLSQLDRGYARSVSEYGKVTTQRNALLRRVQDGRAKTGELAFWDDQLAQLGASIMRERAAALLPLAEHAREAHRRLSGGEEQLDVAYAPRLERWDAARVQRQEKKLPQALAAALEAGRSRDIGAGMTLTGPHRDDLDIVLDGVAAASFASRGQQRTAALALRLAEAKLMAERRGDLPVVLLDDVLSELDEHRRRAVLDALDEWDQLLITSAEAEHFAEGMPKASAVFRVVEGKITKA